MIEKDLEDIRKEIESEALEDEGKPKSGNILLLVMASLMIFLMVSFIYISYPLFNIMHSRIDSSVLQQNMLYADGIVIVFEEGTLQEVLQQYHDHQDVETSLCMLGEINDNVYTIKEVYEPRIFSQSFRHVSHEACIQETIAMFHTHPYERCVASTQDIITLRNAQNRNENVIMIIMCAQSRFSVYS